MPWNAYPFDTQQMLRKKVGDRYVIYGPPRCPGYRFFEKRLTKRNKDLA